MRCKRLGSVIGFLCSQLTTSALVGFCRSAFSPLLCHQLFLVKNIFWKIKQLGTTNLRTYLLKNVASTFVVLNIVKYKKCEQYRGVRQEGGWVCDPNTWEVWRIGNLRPAWATRDPVSKKETNQPTSQQPRWEGRETWGQSGGKWVPFSVPPCY